MASSSDQASGVQSNAELSERLGRVEEQIEHQSDVLERIETRLDEDTDQLAQRVEGIEPQHRRLWFTYQGAKWLLVLGSGSSLLATLVTVLLA